MSIDARERWRAVVSQPLNIEPFHPPSSAFALDVAAASMCGKGHVRSTEHYLAIRLARSQETLLTSLAAADVPSPFEEYGYAMLVADGMGEDGAGARASRVALSTLAHLAIRHGTWNVRPDAETVSDVVEQGRFFYRQAHDAVFRAGRADLQHAHMVTSLTALYIAEDDLFFAHVGHSSAFLFRNGALIQLTGDPALDPQDVTRRSMRARRATGDLGHRFARMIGWRSTAPEVDIEHVKLYSADRLLLCTNGLTDVVTENQIAETLAGRRNPKQECLRLVDLALAADGPDDVTVMLGDYSMPGEAPGVRDDPPAH